MLFLAHHGAAAPSPGVSPASTSATQWAFGGSDSSVFSCSDAACFGNVLPPNITSYSLGWKFYIEWVVIYTQTNVSATQTQFEGQTALNVSATYTFSACEVVTSGQPCVSQSASVSLNGHEASTGFTNVTTGTVNLTAGPGSPANATALAVSNASSQASFNFSGSYAIKSTNASIPTGNANFDFGGSETSSIAFASPLGFVPLDPVPHNAWTSEGKYTAKGTYINGYTISGTENGTTASISKWIPGSVTPSGTLNLSGSDLAAVTLYDNHTTPPTTTTAQLIVLNFTSGNFSAADGWVFAPSQLYGSLLSTAAYVGAGGHATPAAISPSPASTTGLSASSESTYFQHGAGFIGAGLSGNGTLPGGEPGSPAIDLTAGPEPVSVAEAQYSAIVNPGSGSGGLPLLLLLGVAVAGVAVVVGLLAWRRSTHRRPPPPVATLPGANPAVVAPGPGTDGAPAVPPEGPSGPRPG